MKKILCMLIVVISLIQCANSTSPNRQDSEIPSFQQTVTSAERKENMSIVNKYVVQFQITNDTTTLDSMIIQMDKINSMDDWMDFVIKKVWALSVLEKYDQAILYLTGVDESLLNTIGPNYKEITISRLKAIKYLNEGNEEEARKYINRSFSCLSQYMKEHKAEIRNYLRSATTPDAFTGFEFMTVFQYYFYYAYIHGEDKALVELHKLSLEYPQSEKLIDFIRLVIREFEMSSFTMI